MVSVSRAIFKFISYKIVHKAADNLGGISLHIGGHVGVGVEREADEPAVDG